MTIAKKRFGQHFLVDPHKAERLVESLGIQPDDTVLEIGPGTGILTELVLQKGARLVAVEIDRDLAEHLRERFSRSYRLTLIEDDIIKINPHQLFSQGLKILGNLPYNISGAVLEWLVTYHDVIRLAIITVQKEVADRIGAKPSTRDFGSLSVLTQSFFDIKRIFNIPPGCFSPRPRVFSTALAMTPHRKIGDDIDFDAFKDFIYGCFAKKRKKLVNSLLHWSSCPDTAVPRDRLEKYLDQLNIKDDIRAEQLDLKDFVALFKLIRG